jgi:hypothetical protein
MITERDRTIHALETNEVTAERYRQMYQFEARNALTEARKNKERAEEALQKVERYKILKLSADETLEKAKGTLRMARKEGKRAVKKLRKVIAQKDTDMQFLSDVVDTQTDIIIDLKAENKALLLELVKNKATIFEFEVNP